MRFKRLREKIFCCFFSLRIFTSDQSEINPLDAGQLFKKFLNENSGKGSSWGLSQNFSSIS
jgi:hypothetical protein